MDTNLLRINNLRTYFYSELGVAKAVEDVNLSLNREEILGIVGESGCGKTVTALSIMRLIPDPPGKIKSGEPLYSDQIYGMLKTLQKNDLKDEIKLDEFAIETNFSKLQSRPLFNFQTRNALMPIKHLFRIDINKYFLALCF